ncbi:glycerol-3-phosphate dehydrogenase/oxidase [Neobacillus notoginsengisoli]|uniref:Glycerol-3-phosphate dehydrogenase n=1 Tax=Neobacillus notoginsengisoli TaxID=1578198 RepID=A0A417YWB1_9BACI|nr:FAD-dependent oxidoreductase [Neobacillus notoginsengisoli]RHW41672.1 glycerol-3-phosphate dehydrogenase/oxidase [Neobacillus notoginsengisoli]
MAFSNLNRNNMIDKLKGEQFDVLIIGGGITGAGIALDAAARGMKVALVEMQDFAAGTSSRSTKLVHGGLRYLKQFEVKLVSEVGHERSIVHENGPHVTKPEWMLLPFHKGGAFGKMSTSFGLKLYDFLAGVKKGERRMMLNADETLAKEPLIKKTGLKGGGYYVEYRTDDARLTIEVLKEAVESGATAVNYSKADKFIYEDGVICGIVVKDLLTHEEYEVRAKKVVNATGPWVDQVRDIDNSRTGKTLHLSKGVHIVIDQSVFPLKQAIYFDTPDGRMVFAIPRNGKAYVGTTDTFYNGDIADPDITDADKNYLLEAIHYMFPEVVISEKDIESSWAGLRPLIHEDGKAPSEISRKDEIWESPTGLISIAGGKLTGYRKMAETITDLLTKELSGEEGRSFRPCTTHMLPISGGHVGGAANLDAYVESKVESGVMTGFSKEEAKQLAYFYGSNVPKVFELVARHKEEAAEHGLPLVLFAQLIYAIKCEMAVTPVDFFNRRTGDLLFNIDLVREYKQPVIEYMAYKLGWMEEEKSAYIMGLDEAVAHAEEPGQ